MAQPRVFVSSTYYDLRHVRNDIEIFLRGLGYIAVMHDKSGIAYTQDVSLEQSCYNELSSCDIVICIIGSKYGTESSSSIGDYSITMEELKEAIKLGKKIYVYILKDVDSENLTYIRNRSSKDFIPAHVDDIRVHQFISDIKSNVRNNPIRTFESVSEITNDLKSQFAGMFQAMLHRESSLMGSKTYTDLQEVASSINELILNFAENEKSFFDKFNGTIYSISMPIKRLLDILKIKHFQIFAKDKNAIIEFLRCKGYKYCAKNETSEFDYHEESYSEKIILDNRLFDNDGKLIDIRDKGVLDEYIKYQYLQKVEKPDDLPF